MENIAKKTILEEHRLASCVFNHQPQAQVKLLEMVGLIIEMAWEGILFMTTCGKDINAMMAIQNSSFS